MATKKATAGGAVEEQGQAKAGDVLAQLEALRAEFAEYKSRSGGEITALRAETNRLRTEIPAGLEMSGLGRRFGARHVPQEQIDEFLATPRPATEFFSIGRVMLQIQIFPDLPKFTDQLTGQPYRRPILWLKMLRWFGPGSELPAPREQASETDPFMRIGWCDLARDRAVRVTEADIKKYRLLPPNPSPAQVQRILRPEGEYEIAEILRKIQNEEEFERGVFVTGDQYREYLQGEYEIADTQRRVAKERDAQRAKFRPGAEKANLAAALAASSLAGPSAVEA